jgi:hypothetical protein
MLGEHGMGPNVVQEPFVRPGPNRSNGSVSGSWRGSCTYLQQIPACVAALVGDRAATLADNAMKA